MTPARAIGEPSLREVALRVVTKDAAAHVGARVLFVSTGAVYGDGAGSTPPFHEDAPLRPLGEYARTKADAEAECIARSQRQAIVRVRPFNHTGPGQAPSYACSGFAKQIVEVELGVRAPIVDVGDLEAERDFCDVRDIVRAYALALESGEWAGAAGAYRIQERGAFLVAWIRGSWSNVVGLPLEAFYGMLRRMW